MRILVVTNLYPPDFTGGYELGCSQAASALRGRGHEVRILTSAPRSPVPAAPDVCRWLCLTDLSNPYCGARSRPAAAALQEAQSHFVCAFNVHRLIATLDEFRPDVCYIWNLIGLGGLGVMACLEHLGLPWVWHLMDAVPLVLCSRGGQVLPSLAHELERRLGGRYLACSRRLVREIGAGGVPIEGRVEIVPNWVAGQRQPPRTRFYHGGTLRLISAGQIGRHKGMDLIIKAAALLRHRGYEDFDVDLYGKVTDPSFPHWIEKLGLGGHVALRGQCPPDKLAALYGEHAHDVFLFPTWEREPFAFAPLEAASHGCVPLMSRDCGNADWFIHGLDCLKARREPDAFATILADVFEGRIDLETLGRQAQATVWRHFHLDVLLPRIEDALTAEARRPRLAAGTADEAYQIAVLAEKLTQVLTQEAS